jgi:hypothetical protein
MKSWCQRFTLTLKIKLLILARIHLDNYLSHDKIFNVDKRLNDIPWNVIQSSYSILNINIAFSQV